jgi:hypothetical protein
MNAQQLQSVTVEAKIIRKDGTVEDLGEVAAWHRNPVRQAINRVLRRGVATVHNPKE